MRTGGKIASALRPVEPVDASRDGRRVRDEAIDSLRHPGDPSGERRPSRRARPVGAAAESARARSRNPTRSASACGGGAEVARAVRDAHGTRAGVAAGDDEVGRRRRTSFHASGMSGTSHSWSASSHPEGAGAATGARAAAAGRPRRARRAWSRPQRPERRSASPRPRAPTLPCGPATRARSSHASRDHNGGRRAFPAPTTATTMRRVIFTETELAGAFVVELERRADDRGFYARTWCADEFADARAEPARSPRRTSRSTSRGTLRGMHFQRAPHAEAKLFRCTRGAIYDVIVDLRPESPTYLRLDRRRADGRRTAGCCTCRSASRRLPDARGRHGGDLPGVRALHARARAAASATTTRRSASSGRVRCASISEKDAAGPTSIRRPRHEARVIIVDTALAGARGARRARPRRAWWARARWAAASRCRSSPVPGMEIVAIANRTLGDAPSGRTRGRRRRPSTAVDARPSSSARSPRGRARGDRRPAARLRRRRHRRVLEVTGAVEHGARSCCARSSTASTS